MKKQYVIARYWRGSYVETMCEPTTRKDADKRCAKLQEKKTLLMNIRCLKSLLRIKRLLMFNVKLNKYEEDNIKTI